MIPKFRAWDEKNKEMFKDTFAVTESGEVVTVEQDFITNAPDYIFVDHLTIMQSTGLTDKNGKEIFEGDIVMSRCGLFKGVVSLRQDMGAYVIKLIGYKDFVHLRAVANTVEIVGNVWESPELLEVKQ